MKDADIVSCGSNCPVERLKRWRQAALVLNACRRFRNCLDLKKEKEKKEIARKIRKHVHVIQADNLFKQAKETAKVAQEYPDVPRGDYGIKPEELSAMSREHDSLALQKFGGVSQLAKKLKSNLEKGIPGNDEDIVQRKNVFGSNTYPRKKGRSFWRFLGEAFQDLTLLILMVAALASLALGITSEGIKQGWHDGGSVLFAVFLVVVVTAIGDYRQSLQFQNLDDQKRNIHLEVIRGGRRVESSIFDIVVGDVIPLKIGDQVAADGVLISGQSLAIDESSMTGESKIITKDSKSPFLMSGCKVADGYGTMLVTSVGMNTEWGMLMASISEDTGEETPLQVRLNGFATFIGVAGLTVALVVLVVLLARYFTGHTTDAKGMPEFQKGKTRAKHAIGGVVRIVTVAVTIVVVAVPEGLPLAVTLMLAYSMRKMMTDKALVRRLSACETMGSATTICSDKTGTLTLNLMTVVEAHANGKKFDPPNDVSLFSPMLSSVLVEGVAQNTTGNGAAEIVLASCTSFLDANDTLAPLDEQKVAYFKKAINQMAEQSLRCVAIAYRSLELDKVPFDEDKLSQWVIPDDELVLLAIVGIKDPCRPGVRDSVELCTAAGVKVRMVTGDNLQTAKAIALECGILASDADCNEPNLIEGKSFRSKSEAEREEIADKISVMGRSSPNDKLLLVQALRRKGHVVAVTGDGTNDAPALHEADIGLAMGIAGTEVAKESSDIIILDDNFASVVKVVRWGRSVYANIQKFIQFQLTVNVAALIINVVAAFSTGDVPLNAVQLLWVNMIMDTLGALALATEPPTDHLMHRPPVGRREPLITNIMWRNLLIQAVYQVIVLLVLNFRGHDILRLQHDSTELANEVNNTVIFNAFVLCQIFNEFNARKPDRINIFEGVLRNQLFMGVVAVTIIVQVVIVEFLGKFAKTTRLNWRMWLVCFVIGVLR
ncbi:hypothetical protein SOVF_083890 [Spinacia oleracea]|nr:hypothetical protein SOVF_083890 [Spinacia oleracea]